MIPIQPSGLWIPPPQPAVVLVDVIEYITEGGTYTSAAAGNPTNYLTNDVMVAWAARGGDNTAITVPNLSFGDNRDWQTIDTLDTNSTYSVLCWRRCGSDGSDGDLGTFTNAGGIRRATIRFANLANVVGYVNKASQASTSSINYVALNSGNALHDNSLVLCFAHTRNTAADHGPGLRAGATSISSRVTSGGLHGRVMRATTIPTTTWAADSGVANEGGANHNGAHNWAISIRGH